MTTTTTITTTVDTTITTTVDTTITTIVSHDLALIDVVMIDREKNQRKDRPSQRRSILSL
jgi:hypothetical protein